MRAVRDRQTLNKHWLRKWLTGQPHFMIGGAENPYLLRWFVVPRNPFFNIYIHKFLRSDDDRALHDHPWWFISVMLQGAYIEHLPNRSGPIRVAPFQKLFPFGRHPIAFRRATHTHRVELITHYYVDENDQIQRGEKPCWTLIITGRKVRNWGFHCPKGWVPWEKFTEGSVNGAERTQGCGEFE